jgi:TolB protein
VDAHGAPSAPPGEGDRGRHGSRRGLAVGIGAALVTTAVVAAAVALSSSGAGVARQVSGGSNPVAAPRTAPTRAATHPRRGDLIVFAGQGDARYHLFLINPDGSGVVTALTSGPGEEKTPAWSPTRDRIAFAASSEGTTADVPADIYVMAVDGTGMVRLTRSRDHDEDPSWSPDGRSVVFSSSDRSTGRTRIRIANLDGTRPVQLPEPPAGCIDREPSWSPDGVSIAFARKCGDEPSGLFVIRADGTGLQQLDSFGRTPDWSPDGTRLAYTGWARNGPAIFIVSADGTGKLQLTTEGSGDPVWSPGGDRLAFTVNGLAALRIYVVNLDGTDERPLTTGANSANEVMPSW